MSVDATSGVVIQAPEPDVTAKEMIARAEALIPILREQQDENEERGYYSEEVHRRFVAAGFSRMLQPRRYGGYEFDMPSFLKMVVKIATGDPGTGWCLSLCSSHAYIVGARFKEHVQETVFGPDGDFRCPHPVQPVGTAERVDGGWKVSGTANYASGVPYSTWALCNAFAPLPGEDPPRAIVMLVPRADYTVLDNWGSRNGYLLGMNSSGSNSFTLEDVLVRDDYWMPFTWFRQGELITPGYELHGNPMYLGRIPGPYHATIVAPVIGAARAALDEFRSIVLEKKTILPPMVPRYQFHDDQRAYGMAMAMTDAAETILYGWGDQFMERTAEAAATGDPIPLEQDPRWWAMLQQAGGLAASAVETLAQRATSGSTGKGTKLGRYFRDVTMYRQHISSQQIDHAVRNAALYLGASDSWLY